MGNTSAYPPTHTPDHHVSRGINHPGSAFQACGMGGWVCGSVETYAFSYLLPSFTWLKYNSDVTSLLSTSAGLVLQFFLLCQRVMTYSLQWGGEKKWHSQKVFPCLSPILVMETSTLSHHCFPIKGSNHFLSPQRFVTILMFFS